MKCVTVTLIFILTVFSHKGYTQIFPGLEGETLVEALQGEYTPHVLLNDTQVKDTLYARVFNEGDSVHCIYSGLAHDLPFGVDPSQYIFGSGNMTESMNLEHGWPQAKGAGDGTDGNMNMHHLYPSRVAINSDRADFPFKEIADNVSNHWYYLGIEMSNKPSSNINAYSEFLSGSSFEPRESVKGDIARAMFYFWTIYRDDAIAADPNFFNLMKEDLCAWHEQDPADEFERLRNNRIALYQDGKINPFIKDCSLARRAYCSQLPECTLTAIDEQTASESQLLYDPYFHQFSISSAESGEWNFIIINLLGQSIYNDNINANESQILSVPTAGIYVAIALRGQEILTKTFYQN
ncbi:MAG: endonuclease [Bacteroidota bacterium]|nr:endonuclease [Bacteroidota bacterium]